MTNCSSGLEKFYGVPSFILRQDQTITIDGQDVIFDLAYGGAFYAYVHAEQMGLDLTTDHYPQIIAKGKAIKRAIVTAQWKIDHPFETDLSFLYGVIFMQKSANQGIDSRNVCVFADGEVDRSPTGSGVSGRMAIHHLKEGWPLGRPMVNESITGSIFTGVATAVTDFGPSKAVIPEVRGTAFLTRQHPFLHDPQDPHFPGFLLR